MANANLTQTKGSSSWNARIESHSTNGWRVKLWTGASDTGSFITKHTGTWSKGSSVSTSASNLIWTGTMLDSSGSPHETGTTEPLYTPWRVNDGQSNQLSEGQAFIIEFRDIHNSLIAEFTGTINAGGPAPSEPDASVAVTINVPASGAERTTVSLSANVTGTYDSITYAWTVAEGSLNNATSATPTWTRPSVTAAKNVAINLSVSVTGSGTNAKSGTSANASATAVSPRVTDNTPVASAPSVSIDSVAAGREGTTVSLSAAITGGTYDSLTYAWTVAEGTLNDATAQSPTWTRPQVSATKNVAIGLALTAKGNGTKADPGTSATVNATAVNASVTDTPLLPLAVAPSVTIDAVATGDESTTVKLTATISGGTYDGLDYLWSVGGGTLDDATLTSPTWTRPAVSANTDYNINLRITAKGTGTNARSGSSTQKNAGHVVATVRNVAPADTTAPALSTAESNTAGTKIVLTYDESLDTSSTPANGDFSVTSGGSANAVTDVAISGATVTLTLTTSITNGQTVTVSYTKSTNPIQDSAGNDAVNLSSESVTNNVPAVTPVKPDASAPAVAINNIAAGREGTTVVLGATLTGGTYDAIDYAWTVAEGTLNDATLAAPTWTRPTVTATKNVAVGLSITAKGTGTNAKTGTSASASATSKNASVTDTPAAGVSYQSINLRAGWHNYQATPKRHKWDPATSERPQIIDALLDSRDIFLSRFLIREDLVALQFTTDRLGSLTSHPNADLSSTFETGGWLGLDDGDGHTANFQVTEFDATDSAEPYAWRLSGAATTKMSAFIDELTAVSATQALTLTIWDGEGTSPFEDTDDTTAPVFASAATNTAGTKIVLTYGEALDTGSVPANGDFSVSSGGANNAVTDVAISGSTVTLTVTNTIANGDTVTVSYTKGTNPIQDAAENESASLTSESVTNNVPAALSTFTAVSVTGSTVVLTLRNAITSGQTLKLDYTKGSNPIQDAAGNDAASFVDESVTNNVT